MVSVIWVALEWSVSGKACIEQHYRNKKMKNVLQGTLKSFYLSNLQV